MPLAPRLDGVAETFAVGPPSSSGRAARPVALDVAKGATVGIARETGCGTSTIARMRVGRERPAQGRFAIGQRAFDNATPAAFGRMIRSVFQNPVSSGDPQTSIRRRRPAA